MNPAWKAFQRAVFLVSGLSSYIFDKKPGAVIERMSNEDRMDLRKLKSSDIDGSDQSPKIENLTYYVGSNEYYQNKEFEKDKLLFDKEILKDGLGSGFKKYDS